MRTASLSIRRGGAGVPTVLNIVGCVVKDFTGDGILLEPNFPSGLQIQQVTIADSSILSNFGNGIEINPQSASTFINFTIDHTSVDGNGYHSANDAGILINSSILGIRIAGTITSSHVGANTVGLSFTGNPGFVNTTVRVKNSIFTDSLDADVTSGSAANLYLYGSQVDLLNNTAGTVFSDGYNNIGQSATALTGFPTK